MKNSAVFHGDIPQKNKRAFYFAKTSLKDGDSRKVKLSDGFDKLLLHALMKSPTACYTAIFIGMPVAILIAVSIVSFAVILPISLIFGWI